MLAVFASVVLSACGGDAACRLIGERCVESVDGGVSAACRCLEGACTQRRADGPTRGTSCRFAQDCRVDRAAGVCTTDGGVSAWPPPTEGLACGCLRNECHAVWIEPVSCSADVDCALSETPVPRAVAAKKGAKKKPFRPCVDGERTAVCDVKARRCTIVSYRC